MRRQLILVLLILMSTVALVSAQEPEPAPEPGNSQQSPTDSPNMVKGAWRPLSLEPVAAPDGPTVINAEEASDFCSDAPSLDLSASGVDGRTTAVRGFTTQADDPLLSCMWGNPPGAQGNRTAWYKLAPEFNGTITIETQGSTYDTVLAVYIGQCGALTQITCNDDNNYFVSRQSFQVQAGEEYFIEVADWQSGASGSVDLNLLAVVQPGVSNWEVTSSGADTESFRSRHIVVADGSKLYVIGGQTVLGSNSVRTPSTYVYDTTNGSVQFLENMRVADGLGYSNTTGVLIDGRIYIPAGYTGNDNAYDGSHEVYDIALRRWLQPPNDLLTAPNNWADGLPAIYSQATVYDFGGPPGSGYFLSGGLTGPFPVSDDSAGWTPRPELYFYSVDSNSWATLNSMDIGRFGHVAAMQSIDDQEHLCVAGGMSGDPGNSREVLASTECYNVNQGNWTDFDFAPLNYARYFASSAVDSQGNWYVFGGYDDAGNTVAFTERYDAASDRWVPLSEGFNVGSVNPRDQQAFGNPPRAWSRGDYVGTTLWIIGGEAKGQQVINMVQRATLFRSNEPLYLPVMRDEQATGQRFDTFATAGFVPYANELHGRFYTADDIVDIYSFDVPWPPQQVIVRLTHLGSGNELDLVLYSANKSFIASDPQIGTKTEEISVWLNPGRYFAAVERASPPIGNDPSSAKFLLQVGPG